MTRPFTRVLAIASVAVASALAGAPSRAGTELGWIEIEKAPLEQPKPLSFLAKDEAPKTLRGIVAALDEAAGRDDLKGVVIRLREPELNRTQVEEIGAAVRNARAKGKKVHVFTEVYGPAELLLGSYADEVIVQKGGAVSFPGLYMEEMFLADSLAMIGVKADFVQIGDYKGADEMFVNSAPSKPWDENINRLLDGLYGAMRAQLMKGRRMSAEQLDKAMEEAWMLSPEQAIKLGLIDAEVDRLDLDKHLDKEYGDFEYATDLGPSEQAQRMDMSNPFALLGQIMEPPKRVLKRDAIAMIHVDGAIVDGESTDGGPLGGPSVGSLTMREALKQVEDEDKVKGLVIRIESPGGSAIASESIWLGVRDVAKKKPVWVSVGSMAASGGYYIAVSGDRIYVDPSSIVGSIGVVGGKFALGGLFDMVKLHVYPRARGPHADMFSSLKAWSDTERALVRSRMLETYEKFVDRVKQGRKGIDISATAEGRLFVGQTAIDMKMADRIGGVDVALTELAAELGLKDGGYDVVSYPAPKSLAEVLESMFGRFVQAPGVDGHAPGGLLAEIGGALRELVGPRAWPALRDSINAAAQVRTEPVLLVTPKALLFK